MKKITLCVLIGITVSIFGISHVSAYEPITSQRLLILKENEIAKNIKYGQIFLELSDSFFKNYGKNIQSLDRMQIFIGTKIAKYELWEKWGFDEDDIFSKEELLVRNMLLYLQLHVDRYTSEIGIDTNNWDKLSLEKFNLSFLIPRDYQLEYIDFGKPGNISQEEFLKLEGGVLHLRKGDSTIRLFVNIDGFGPLPIAFRSYEISRGEKGLHIKSLKYYDSSNISQNMTSFIDYRGNWINFWNTPHTSTDKRIFEVFLENVKILEE